MTEHEARAGEFNQLTSFSSPGSNRTDVPAAILSRMPRAAARSNCKRVVDLEEVIVAADLDRTIARMPHDDFCRPAADVGLDAAVFARRYSPGFMSVLTEWDRARSPASCRREMSPRPEPRGSSRRCRA